MRPIGIALGILGVCRATADSQVYSPKAGVGLAFTIANPAGQLAGALNVFVPMNLGSHFRLEPPIAWHTTSSEEAPANPPSPAGGGSGPRPARPLGPRLPSRQPAPGGLAI